MIAIDLCQVNYKTLLVTYLSGMQKKEKSSRNVDLLDLKMIDYIAGAKNVEKDQKVNQKVFVHI